MLHTAYTQPGSNEGIIVDRSRAASNRVWFVQSTHADASDTAAFGRHPDRPFATVDYLISNASTLGLTAYDTVVIGPGHNEGLANDQWAFSVASITYMAHERAVGNLAPIFDFGHANTSMDVTANNNVFKGLKFRPSITDVLIAVELATDVTGTQFIDCEWIEGEDGAGVDDFIKSLVLTSGNHDTKIHNCTMRSHASAAGYTHGIHIAAASNRLDLHNVIIDGAYATGGIVEAAAGVNHIATALSIDTTGTNMSWNGSSTFAKRGASGGANLDAAAAEDIAGNLIGRNDNNNAADTSSVAANADGSVLERQEYMQSTLIGGIDAATTDSLHGKLGTDTEMGDRSLWDLIMGSGPVAYPAAAAPANDVSLLEVLRDIWDALRNGTGGTEPGANKSIVDCLGSDGVAVTDSAVTVLGAIGANNANNAFDSSTVAANADGSVLERQEALKDQTDKIDGAALTAAPTANSLAAFIASGGTALGTELADSKSILDALGTDGTTITDATASVIATMGANNANNAFGSATVAHNRDGSILERLEHLAQSCELCVEKSDGEVLNGADDIFTITGGPVYAMLTGIVTTQIGGASNAKLQITTTEPAATFDLNAGAVAIDNDIAGNSYRMVGATGVFTPDANGAVIIDPVTVEDVWYLLPVGTVHFTCSAAQTGNVKWYMRYKPMSPDSVVVAAA